MTTRLASPQAGAAAVQPPGAVITGTGCAFPPGHSQQEYWDGFYGPHNGDGRWARKVFLSAGCSRRHTAVDPTVEDVSQWSTGARMDRYLREALPLALDAARSALDAAGLVASDLGMLVVASCTGYVTPGLDIRLAQALDAAPSLQRLLVGHMGCYAALPALGAASDHVVARRRPALLVCAEIASLHVQPASADLEQVVAHALFSDGAAAAVLEPSGAGGDADACRGLTVVDVAASTDVDTADHMRWDVTDLGFRMGLSRRVPDVLDRHVGPLVDGLLARNGVGPDEVDGWAVHPGGPRILEVVADRLGLHGAALDVSRAVLDQHGNCSSATVLVVLAELMAARPPGPGRHVVALAFGPGLTLYGVLLRATGPDPERAAPGGR
jgi:alkylresorcinol/alkylpyrone synthase